MAKAGKKRRVIRLVLIGVVAGIAMQAYFFIDQTRISHEVTEAQSTAQASLSPATAPDDARRWLETNGYRVVVWNPHDPRGFVGRGTSAIGGSLIVQGQRQIRAEGWLKKPTWANVTFRFFPDGLIRDVQAEPFPVELPATRPAD